MTPLELLAHELGYDDPLDNADGRRLELDQKLDSLRLDSLEFVDLIQSVEAARSITLDPTALALAITVGDFVKVIEGARANASISG